MMDISLNPLNDIITDTDSAKDTFEGQVRDLSLKGLGVVDHPNGMVFFIAGSWPGDIGRFTIEKQNKRYGIASLTELIVPSPHRVQPACPHQGMSAGKCGGCSWMIADYAAQLRFKERLVCHSLKRAGLITDSTNGVKPIWGSPLTFGYRNRAQIKTDGHELGFVSAQSHALAPIKDCLILTSENRKTLNELRKQLPRSDWQPRMANHIWNFIDIDDETPLHEIILNRRLPFKQGNTLQNSRMRQWLAATINILAQSHAEIIELFAGSGNFTEILSQHAINSNIVAVEVAEEAANILHQRQLPNVTVCASDLTRKGSWNQIKKLCRYPQILVLDPPREGFNELNNFLNTFKSIEAIIYVSCDVHSFCHDICTLRSDDWRISEVQPVDQFPHTPHVELLSVIKRNAEKFRAN